MATIFILTNEWRRNDGDGGHILIGAYTTRELAQVRLAQEKAECLLEDVYRTDRYGDESRVSIESDTPDNFTIEKDDYSSFDTYEVIETPIDELKAD